MALANFMFNGSYLRIVRLVFSKFEKNITCSLQISSKDTDGTMSSWACREISVSGNRNILGIVVSDKPPENPKNGDAYYLTQNNNLQGVWENYPNHIAAWDNLRNDWNYWVAHSWHDILYREDTKEYVLLKDGAFTRCVCYDDVRIWDNFFTPELLNNSNHMKQFYLFLKSLDEFKDCIDV